MIVPIYCRNAQGVNASAAWRHVSDIVACVFADETAANYANVNDP